MFSRDVPLHGKLRGWFSIELSQYCGTPASLIVWGQAVVEGMGLLEFFV